MAKGSLRVNGIIVDADGEIKASTGDSIVIREDDGSAVITVDTSGNVGINTTAPGAQFDIRGPAGTGTASASVLRMSTAETSVVDADQLGRIEFIAPLEAGGTDAILVGASIHAEADATFAADNNSTELVFSTGASEAAAEKMRIDSAGNVGIGTTSPDLMGVNSDLALTISAGTSGNVSPYLEIQGSRTSNNARFGGIMGFHQGNRVAGMLFNRADDDAHGQIAFETEGGSGATVRMTIDQDGKVGIGNTAPDTKVHISGTDATTAALMIEDTDATANQRRFRIYSSAQKVYFDNPNDAYSSATDIMTFNLGNQRVGIGSTSPVSLLDVAGEITVQSKIYAAAGTSLSLQSPASADVIILTNGANERVRIASAGYVGINTSAPSSMLHLYTATNTDKLTIESTEAGTSTSGFGINLYRNSASAADNDVMSNIRFIGKNDAGSPEDVTYAQMYSRIIDASDGTEDGALHIQTMKDGSLTSTFTVSGNAVGIMESTPLFSLHVAGTLGIKTAQPTLTFDRGGAYAWTIRNGDGTGSFPLSTLNIVNNAGSPKMTFKDNGYIGISVTAPGVALDVAGAIRATSDITAYHSSDITLKENISPISNALTKLDSLNGVCFDWTDEHINSNGGPHDYFMQKRDVGVIAQELKEVLPEAVRQREDGTLAVKYDGVIPLLIQAIKELKSEINSVRN